MSAISALAGILVFALAMAAAILLLIFVLVPLFRGLGWLVMNLFHGVGWLFSHTIVLRGAGAKTTLYMLSSDSQRSWSMTRP